MPLTRIGGKLGVATTGGNATELQVHIHENASDRQHRVERSGGRIDVFLRKAVADVIGGGGADAALRNRYGVKPAAQGA